MGAAPPQKGAREDAESSSCCGCCRRGQQGTPQPSPHSVTCAASTRADAPPGAQPQRELGYVLKFAACMDDQEALETDGVFTDGGGVCTSAWCIIMSSRRPGGSLENCSWIDVVTNHRLQVRAWGKSATSGVREQREECGHAYGQYMRLTVSRAEMHLSGVPFSVDNRFAPAEVRTGRRRALLISNEYHVPVRVMERDAQGRLIKRWRMTIPQLQGTHADQVKIKRWLVEQEGWAPGDILHLRDDAGRQPTREETLRAFAWLTDGARDGDALWFSYAGHGVEVKARADHTELNGKDEAMVCSDGELIIDDVIHERLVEKVPRQAQLTCLFDCCHSGTICDLPYFVLIEGSKLWHREHGEDLLRQHHAARPAADDAAASLLVPPQQTSMPRAPSAAADGEALPSGLFTRRGKGGETVDNSPVHSDAARLKRQREARLAAEAGGAAVPPSPAVQEVY